MKISKDEFIKSSNELYNNKYDYSKVEYYNTGVKVCIICPEHGEFWKTPMNHLLGQGCKLCKLAEKRLSINEFIEKARKVHGNKYDYSKAEYINYNTKVCIICPEHGEFWQTPRSHLRGCGCPICGGCEKLTTEEFIEKAKKVHGDKYDYSNAKYVNNSTKVCIICPEHGEFWQTPNAHVSAKHECPMCSHQSYKYSYNEITNLIKNKYPNINTISTSYSNRNEIGKFYCNCVDDNNEVHGIFTKKFVDVLRHGCPKCGQYSKLNKEIFVERSNKVHNNKYDYSKVEYKTSEDKVCIICPEHGEFWQTPHSHLSGVGCPLCSKEKNINETCLYEYIKNNINCKIIREKKFKWLGLKSIDIFIPSIKVAIEYQGEQHFEPIKFYGGEKAYAETIKRDQEKYKLCTENGIKLFYFSNAKNIPTNYIDTIYTEKENLLQEIKKIFISKEL